MPGFLTRYNEQVTVRFDDDYWVRARRHLKRGDYKAAQAVLVSPVMRYNIGAERDSDVNAETRGEVDSSGYQNELVARALEEWNLTDDDGQVIPLGRNDPVTGPDPIRRSAVDALPQEVFEKIFEAIGGVKKKPAEQNGADPQDPFRQSSPVGAVSGRKSAR